MPVGTVTLTFTGTDAMVRDLRGRSKRAQDAIAGGLKQSAEEIMTDSKQYYVPVDTGLLRSTGRVDPVRRTGREYEVSLHYGGAASNRALAIHEHPSSHSPRSWRGKGVSDIRSVRGRIPWTVSGKGRGPKYLTRPMLAAVRSGRIIAIIVKRVNEALR